MANVRKFDVEQATNLRKSGMSFEEIAQTLGCSVAWCSKELRGVEKEGISVEGKLKIKQEAIQILEDALLKLRNI